MDLASQLRSAIAAQSLPLPSASFLTHLTTSRSPPPPLPSLLATAKARLLTADLTSTSILDPSLASFPPGISDPSTKEMKLLRDIFAQVLDVENLSVSRWEQIEELEAVERGERTRGREVIRVAAEEDTSSGVVDDTQSQAQAPTQAGPKATHRLVLQDVKGVRVFGVEVKRMAGVGVGRTLIGEKMLVRKGTVVARGTVLLGPESCALLGGKVEGWHDAWAEGRLARLREQVSRLA